MAIQAFQLNDVVSVRSLPGFLEAAHHPVHHTHHHHMRPIFIISFLPSAIIFCIRSCMALRCSTSLVTTAAIASTFLSGGALFISATSLSNSASCSFHLDIIFPHVHFHHVSRILAHPSHHSLTAVLLLLRLIGGF